MELFVDFNSAVRIALGLLSLITLIAWCRWRGIPQDQKKDEPPLWPNGRERQETNSKIEYL